MCIQVYPCVCTYIYIYIYAYVCACMHAYMYVCLQVHSCIFIRVCVCVCVSARWKYKKYILYISKPSMSNYFIHCPSAITATMPSMSWSPPLWPGWSRQPSSTKSWCPTKAEHALLGDVSSQWPQGTNVPILNKSSHLLRGHQTLDFCCMSISFCVQGVLCV